jgi:hypothetical protein
MIFFSSRDPRYQNLHTPDHLQRTQIDMAYQKDVSAYRTRATKAFHYLIADETPTAHNVPLFNVVDRMIDVLSISPTISTALVSSKEVRGRCDATEVVRQINDATSVMGLDEDARHRILGIATDSAAYGMAAVNELQTSWGAFLMKVRCPSHLIHLVVEFVVNLTDEDLNVVIDGIQCPGTNLKSVLDFITSVIEMRDLRELYGLIPVIPTFHRIRWASLNKTSGKLVKYWNAIVQASEEVLKEPRASQTFVRKTLLDDRSILTKLVFIREFTRKMLIHIEWFQSDSPRAHEVYGRLVAIQNGLNPLFSDIEIEHIIALGACPDDLKRMMRTVIKTACKAAYNVWLDKMTRNQDEETVLIYQQIAFFDPGSRDAFTHSTDDLLSLLRPIHDSIFGAPDDGVDPLRVHSIHFCGKF